MPDEIRNPLRIFLCHSAEDKPRVRELCTRLIGDGFDPWLDERKLFPGVRWRGTINTAIRSSHIVLVCLSRTSVNKEGFVQAELRQALRVAEEKPEHTIFVIPVRLEECDVPTPLLEFQWVDLYRENGYGRLLLALQERCSSLGRPLPGPDALAWRQVMFQDQFSLYPPVCARTDFFGREAILKSLSGQLLDRQSFVLCGNRKIGKTSLISQLPDFASFALCAIIAGQSFVRLDPPTVCEHICEAFIRALQRTRPDPPSITLAASSAGWANQFESNLAIIHQALGGTRRQNLILLFDEAEVFAFANRSEIEPLLEVIASVHQSGVMTPVFVTKIGRRGGAADELERFGSRVWLGAMGRHECDQMIMVIASRMELMFEESALSSLYESSGGIPFLARELASVAVRKCRVRPSEVTRDIILDSANEYAFSDRWGGFLRLLYENVSPEEQQVLIALSSHPQEPIPNTAAFQRQKLSTSDIQQALDTLQKRSLVEPQRNTYRIRVHLLEQWIQQMVLPWVIRNGEV